MASNILMPKLGLTMTEGTVNEWYVKVGDPVKKGEAVCLISSEKLTMDVEAPEDGVLLSIIVAEFEDTPVSEPIGVVGQPGENVSEVVDEVLEEVVEIKEAEKPVEKTTVVAPERKSDERIFASPLARKLAREAGIPLEKVTGTGGNQRITKRDIERAQLEGVGESVATVTFQSERQDVSGLSPMRQVIAERMHNSLQQTAQLTHHRRVSLDNLMAFRKEVKGNLAEGEVAPGLSITVLVAKAAILALKEHPEMNSHFAEGELTEHESIHLGMATSLENGLVVPVIKDADKLSLNEIGLSITSLAAQARENTLSPKSLSGSTFTITNLGRSGVEYFTPILNTPETGILGLGSLQKTVKLASDGTVYESSELPLSLTFDHRIVDGAPAADFLGTLANYLENPYRLVL